MLSKADLEKLDINMLAMYCLRVAENAPAGSEVAEQAYELKLEWNDLISTAKDRAAKSRWLKTRMVELLSGSEFLAPTRYNGAPSNKTRLQALACKQAAG